MEYESFFLEHVNELKNLNFNNKYLDYQEKTFFKFIGVVLKSGIKKKRKCNEN